MKYDLIQAMSRIKFSKIKKPKYCLNFIQALMRRTKAPQSHSHHLCRGHDGHR